MYNSRKTLVTLAPNMPFGLSFMGRKFSEQQLIQYAYAFEQATQVRQNGPDPYISPNVELADVAVKSSPSEESTGVTNLQIYWLVTILVVVMTYVVG